MKPIVSALGALLAGSVMAAPSETLPLAPRSAPIATAAPADPADPWPDTVTLSRGTVVRCRIVTASAEGIAIEYPVRGSIRPQPMSRTLAWSDLRSADFAMDTEFHRLVTATNPLKDTPRLAARWAALSPLVSRPNHPAGELGLSLARLSLTHPESSARHRALDACRLVATADWNPSRRHHARWLQAKVLSALGRSEEAVREARLLANEPETTPEAAMPACVMVARADFAALRKLVEENPRWEDDESVRPERETLFHQALDAALKPSVFYGALEEHATQGLWTAIELLEFDHNLPAAAERARDLLSLYPASPRAADATTFLQRHHLPLDPAAQQDDPPAPVVTPASTVAPASTPGAEPVVQRRLRYAAPHPNATR